MKVKNLKTILDKFDEEIPVYIQIKDEKGWGLYQVFTFDKKNVALQNNDGVQYIAFGDVLKSGEVGMCAFDGSKISG